MLHEVLLATRNPCFRSSQAWRTRTRRSGLLGYVIARKHSNASRATDYGVAGVRGLRCPEDFRKLAKDSVEQCNKIRRNVLYENYGSKLAQLKDIDLISSTVCSVIDAAEFIRNVHYESEFREAAEDAFDYLSEYISELNTEAGLHTILKSIIISEDTMDSFTEEQRLVAMTLTADFERNGIHLPVRERNKLAEIQNESVRLESMFNLNISRIGELATKSIPASSLQGVPLAVLPKPRDGLIEIPIDTATRNLLLKTAKSAITRRAILHAQNAACASLNEQVLKRLVEVRYRLARCLGFRSYADRALKDNVLDHPEHVTRFLEDLSNSIRKKANEETQLLQKLKVENEGEDSGPIQAWDLMYYMSVAKTNTYKLDGSYISQYFTLNGILDGLSQLCAQLFGTCSRMVLPQAHQHPSSEPAPIGSELVEIPLRSEESWYRSNNSSNDYAAIRKFELHHRTEGIQGIIYMDLGNRPGKFPHAAHYTIRCGCENGVDSPTTFHGKHFQTPIVALVTSFSLNRMLNGERLLHHGEVETLLHEFGHALHSMFSRTELQHLSGTRGPLDWVEVPSHLFEHFAWDSRSLRLLSSHYVTKQHLPLDAVNTLRNSKNSFIGLETQQQLLFAAVDQQLFGDLGDDHVSIESIVAEEHRRFMGNVAFEQEASKWPNWFSHFTGYGASYYSYLYDRILAANIWKKHFARDSLSRDAGEKLRCTVLRHGCARDPHKMLNEIMDGETPTVDCLFSE